MVIDKGLLSSPPPGGYGVDVAGSCPVGRGSLDPTTRTLCRKVSLSSQVMPISSARKFPSASNTSACIGGRGLRVGVGGP